MSREGFAWVGLVLVGVVGARILVQVQVRSCNLHRETAITLDILNLGQLSVSVPHTNYGNRAGMYQHCQDVLYDEGEHHGEE
ncbi:hypothetical protein EDB80DRAFT_720134 [Ilyonectria destructans]|nr:hypothetical protein EDB80DRAFT_720134 [Ilyonectria destructans]